MIEQQGQVLKIVDGRGFVRIGSRSGCAACDDGKGCGAGIFNLLIRRRPVTVDTECPEEVRVGQNVIIGLAEDVFLALLARLYVLPLVAGLAGAAIGHYISVGAEHRWATDLSTLLLGIVMASSAIWWNRSNSREFPGKIKVCILRTVTAIEHSGCSVRENNGDKNKE